MYVYFIGVLMDIKINLRIIIYWNATCILWIRSRMIECDITLIYQKHVFNEDLVYVHK